MKTLHTRRWLVLAALLALVLAVALCACSGGQEPSREMDTPVETATPTPTPTATPEPTATPTPTPAPTPEATVEPTTEATPEPTNDNAELVALKNGEVNDNGNLTSSANESNNGKTEGNSASTKKPNAPVVEITPAPDKYDENGDVPSDWVPPDNTDPEFDAWFQEMLDSNDPDVVQAGKEAGARAEEYVENGLGYADGC